MGKDKFYKGATSIVAVGVTVGDQKMQIYGNTLTVMETRSGGRHTLREVTEEFSVYADGSQVVISANTWVITGPSSNNKGYATLKITRQSVAKGLFALGYYYNLYARIPFANTEASSGLCRALASGSSKSSWSHWTENTAKYWNGNTATSSWYTLDDLDALLYTAPLGGYKPTENAEQACKANKLDIEESKKICKIAGPDTNVPGLLDACVYDYCLTGSDQIVADSKLAGAITRAEMNAANEPTATVGCGSC